MKLSSLLEGLWSPKLDRYNSWERRPGDTPLQDLVMSSRWDHMTCKKYLLIFTSECMTIWDISFCKVTWQSSYDGKECLQSVNKIGQQVYLRKSASLPQRYTCCPILLTDWSLSRMKISSTLLYKTYISIQHCPVPLLFQILQYLCHAHL